MSSHTTSTARVHGRGICASAVRALGAAALMGALSSGAQAMALILDDFSSSSEQALFQLNGNAGFVGNALRLTPDAQSQAGSAFLKQPLFIQSTADFSTQFTFRIHSAQGQFGPGLSDGFAFVVQGGGDQFLGNGGGSLGYLGATNPASYFYAVEFDIHQNGGDVSNNSLAVVRVAPALGGPVATTVGQVDLNTKLNGHALENGNEWTAMLQYSFHNQVRQLNVFLAEGNDTLQYVLGVQLPDELFHFGGASTTMGFTGGTGGGFAAQDILAWQFQVPEPGSLPLLAMAGLGLLAAGRRRASHPAQG